MLPVIAKPDGRKGRRNMRIKIKLRYCGTCNKTETYIMKEEVKTGPLEGGVGRKALENEKIEGKLP